MIRIGQYLLEQGVITEEQLYDALQHQVLYGSRIGTCLVELGYLDTNDLTKLLAQYH